MEVRLRHQQRHRFGGQAPRDRRLGRAGANLWALVRGVSGKLFDSRLQSGRELGSRGGLLPKEPQGPVGVHVEGVRGRRGGGQGEGEREGGAGKRGVGRYAAVQELWQLQPFQDGFADGETLGVTLEDGGCLLWAFGSSVRISQLLLTTLPDGEGWRKRSCSVKRLRTMLFIIFPMTKETSCLLLHHLLVLHYLSVSLDASPPRRVMRLSCHQLLHHLPLLLLFDKVLGNTSPPALPLGQILVQIGILWRFN